MRRFYFVMCALLALFLCCQVEPEQIVYVQLVPKNSFDSETAWAMLRSLPW